MFFTALKDLIVDTLDELDTVAAEAMDAINIKKQSEKEDEEES
jgi:hypothetical protein